VTHTEPQPSQAEAERSEISKEQSPMLDVNPAHHARG
jgi:hypothetical protein